MNDGFGSRIGSSYGLDDGRNSGDILLLRNLGSSWLNDRRMMMLDHAKDGNLKITHATVKRCFCSRCLLSFCLKPSMS